MSSWGPDSSGLKDLGWRDKDELYPHPWCFIRPPRIQHDKDICGTFPLWKRGSEGDLLHIAPSISATCKIPLSLPFLKGENCGVLLLCLYLLNVVARSPSTLSFWVPTRRERILTEIMPVYFTAVMVRQAHHERLLQYRCTLAIIIAR